MTAEERRLELCRERREHWKRWGPYVSERAWGTVLEDYGSHGAAWDFLGHDHARSKAYRWNEDGLAGICDRHQVASHGWPALVQAVLSLRGDWLAGDPASPPPPQERKQGRNRDWRQLYNADAISMPDKWEYPSDATWDLAFHCVPLAMLACERAAHAHGARMVYAHTGAAWRVYKMEKKRRGMGDRTFLQSIFHKLMLNFTWWVNRKDAEGRYVFQGGFLGLDNIGIFDRSAPLPTGGHIEQADGTGWMAMYALNLLAIAMELAREDSAYEDVASKFWEHFLHIANAMNHLGNDGEGLWDEQDDFFTTFFICRMEIICR